jgi:hypothetical protein
MKIALLIISASAFGFPLDAKAQSSSPISPTTDSAPAVSVLVKTNRAGIGSEQLRNGQRPVARSNADTSHVNVGARLANAFLGTVFGGLGGAALGAVIGAAIDSRGSDEVTIPASILLGFLGAIVGAGVGLIVGTFWPT